MPPRQLDTPQPTWAGLKTAGGTDDAWKERDHAGSTARPVPCRYHLAGIMRAGEREPRLFGPLALHPAYITLRLHSLRAYIASSGRQCVPCLASVTCRRRTEGAGGHLLVHGGGGGGGWLSSSRSTCCRIEARRMTDRQSRGRQQRRDGRTGNPVEFRAGLADQTLHNRKDQQSRTGAAPSMSEVGGSGSRRD